MTPSSSRESDTHPVDPAAPLRSPTDDADEDEILLVLDTEPVPSLSEEVSGLMSRLASLSSIGSASGPARAASESGSNTSASESADSAPMARPSRFWVWGLILMALLVLVVLRMFS